MRPWMAGVALLLGAPSLAGPSGEPAGAIRVHVAIAAEPGPHATARELSDSVKDLTKSLAGTREIALVDTPQEAQVVVLVKDRGMGQRPTGYIGQMGQQPSSTFDPGRMIIAEEMWVQATLAAGEERQDLFGSSPANTWGGCAKDLGKQVRGWV